MDALTCRSARLGCRLVHTLYDELTNCQSIQRLRSSIECMSQQKKMIERTFSTFSTAALGASDPGPSWVSLNVPVGLEALPRKASTSPLVNIPRRPVPLIFPGS